MDLNLVGSIEEQNRTQGLNLFFNRNFKVVISDESGTILFDDNMISGFFACSKKLFLTVYDVISKQNVEEKLDKLLEGRFFKKKQKVNILLSRFDKNDNEVYHVNYSDCVLKKYHGKNFTHNSNDPAQWYLEFRLGEKKIIKSSIYDYENNEDSYEILKTMQKKNDGDDIIKNVANLKKTDKMPMDLNLGKKVKYTAPIKRVEKVVEQAKKVNGVNVKNEHRFYGASIDSFDFNSIEKSLKSEIEKLENKLHK